MARHCGIVAASACAAAALLWFLLSRESSNHVAPPGVLLITIDTLRADHLSAYGYARRTSPNLDALAAQGALFEVAYSEANSTNPSHTTILTGTHSQTHGVVDTPQGFSVAGLPTLAERLQAAGYATAAIVSAHHLNQGPSGLGRGFDTYVDVEDTQRRATDSLAPARQWIAAHADQPFFLWLHLFDPHALYEPPAPYDTRFPSAPSPRIDVILGRLTRDDFFRSQPLSADERHTLTNQFRLPFRASIGLNRIGVTASELAYLTALYDGEIAYTDAMLGELFADLSRLGLDDKTLVVVTADHGEAFGEHGFYCMHRTIYEETLRVPLILRYSGRISPGQRLQVPVHHVDIAPTVLQYAGLPLSKTLAGEGLAPLISDGAPFPTRPVFAVHTNLNAAMVRDGPWKLIFSRPEVKANWIAASKREGRIPLIHPVSEELYDIASDPGETKDVADINPTIVERLRRLYAERFPANATIPSGRPVDAETSERLRALGYGD